MTILVYISRRPKPLQPKKRLAIAPPPSNLSWKRPPRGKPRRAKTQPFVARRARLRLQPSPPQPSNLVYRKPRRLRVRRPKVLRPKIRGVFLQIAPLVFRLLRRRPIKRRKLSLFRRRYVPVPAAAPAAPLMFKPRRRTSIKRRKWFGLRKRLVPAPAPVSFIAAPPRRRLKIKRARIAPRKKLLIAAAVVLLLAVAPRRRWFKRKRAAWTLRGHRPLFISSAPAPVTATFIMWPYAPPSLSLSLP